MKTLIVVLGPTGVGKTALCLHLAKRYAAHIISADSRQMFTELPIGTAAATPEEQQQAVHHFVGNSTTIIARRASSQTPFPYSISFSRTTMWP